MNDLESIEQLLQTDLAESIPNQLFKNSLKQRLLQRSVNKRKQVIFQWLAITLTGVVAGVALYGLATLIKKNYGKLLCCGACDSYESSS